MPNKHHYWEEITHVHKQNIKASERPVPHTPPHHLTIQQLLQMLSALTSDWGNRRKQEQLSYRQHFWPTIFDNKEWWELVNGFLMKERFKSWWNPWCFDGRLDGTNVKKATVVVSFVEQVTLEVTLTLVHAVQWCRMVSLLVCHQRR